MATYGGIARNYEGNFLLDWSINLACCSITVAELWGVFWGLFMSRNLGYENIWVEMDSLSVFHLIQHDVPPPPCPWVPD